MRKFSKKKLNYKNYHLKKSKKTKKLHNSKKICIFAPVIKLISHLSKSFTITIINTFINYKKKQKS